MLFLAFLIIVMPEKCMRLLQGKGVLLGAILIHISLYSHPAASINQGRGEISVNGRIIASACAIGTESIDQTIRMKTVPISKIMRDGQSERQIFSITLVNCVLERLNPALDHWRYFDVTFEGRNDVGYFGVNGSARGIALQISDGRGNVAVPGMPMTRIKIKSGGMTFKYGLRLVGNQQVLKAGNYTSAVRFKMDYY